MPPVSAPDLSSPESPESEIVATPTTLDNAQPTPINDATPSTAYQTEQHRFETALEGADVASEPAPETQLDPETTSIDLLERYRKIDAEIEQAKNLIEGGTEQASEGLSRLKSALEKRKELEKEDQAEQALVARTASNEAEAVEAEKTATLGEYDRTVPSTPDVEPQEQANPVPAQDITRFPGHTEQAQSSDPDANSFVRLGAEVPATNTSAEVAVKDQLDLHQQLQQDDVAPETGQTPPEA